MGPDMPLVDLDPYHPEGNACGEIIKFEKKFGKVGAPTFQNQENATVETGFDFLTPNSH
ncbi:Uncharacterized protein XB16_1453 [Leptospira santarosai]|uniref:Uncharacterized protein n=1 Tax=Leptospira santarosai TaxID=28183 RepID=A0A2P1QS93_9LEPT|nr:Uncharacterized protein XB16_1453 [Leptospira santarosai]